MLKEAKLMSSKQHVLTRKKDETSTHFFEGKKNWLTQLEPSHEQSTCAGKTNHFQTIGSIFEKKKTNIQTTTTKKHIKG